MKLFFPAEADPKETRTALTAATASRYQKLGAEVIAEGALLDKMGPIPGVIRHNEAAYPTCNIIATVGRPSDEMLARAPKGAVWVGLLSPFADTTPAERYAAHGVGAIALENLPRITLAQKMDALSSQASLAGYAAVVKAADLSDKVFPMMMTPAGTLQPVRLFVIGVGVAGLQAIATAKRLGARVEAFDTRPIVEEQVRSLGAKFVKIDIGATGQSAQGYAVALTPEQIQKQKDGMAKVVAQSDIVITTAKVFGKKPPVLVTSAMLDGMRAGAVVIDLACVAGAQGNVEGSRFDELVTTAKGVKIFGGGSLERTIESDSSEMYASNVAALVEHFWDAKEKVIKLDPASDLLKTAYLNPQK
jgi:H+-translocating NAD(P) transhydrogenase subunit alpha